MGMKFRFSGVIPANLLPFREDLSIDEPNYRKHLRWLADVPGTTAIVANGHAAEVSSLDRAERRRCLEIALDEVGDRTPVITGIFTDSTLEAVDMAREAKALGAAGGLVFPPTLFAWGAQLRPEMALTHFKMIADATDLPLIVFEYPPAQGTGYSPDTLAQLALIPSVVGVKDWSNDIVAFERNLRALRGAGRPVAMLSSYTMSLMASYLLGADGSISGMGSVATDLQANLFAAVQRQDLDAVKAINDRLDPLVRVFYAPPFLDMHNRMKEALVMLGRLDRAVVRQPLEKIPPADMERVRTALIKTGLLQAGKAGV